MDAAGFKAKGPDDFDFVGMPDDEFELMNFLLVRLEWARTFKPAKVRDGGADTVQRSETKPSKYDYCWQSKRFTKRIGWDKCEESLKQALTTWHPKRYTFIFPRDLTAAEERTFATKFGHAGILVDYWSASELYARLIGSDGGNRIARWFFRSSDLERQEMYRAIAAGAGAGPVENASQALERIRKAGAYLADLDPFFDYPTSIHRQGGASQPIAPGTVMSIFEGDGKVGMRTDVVPVAPEVMEKFAPEFTLTPTPDEAGRLAAERLQAVLADGGGGEITQGLEMTYTQLPPGLSHLLNQPFKAAFVFGKAEDIRPPSPPWRARLTAGNDRANDPSVDVLLIQVAPPDGSDVALEGSVAGLTAKLLMTKHGTRGQLTFNLHYERDDSAARDQLAVVQFMNAFSAAAELLITDIGDTRRPPLSIPVPLQRPSRLDDLEAFLRDLVVIEDWAEVRLQLPSDIPVEDVQTIANVSANIRNGSISGTLNKFEMTAAGTAVERLEAEGMQLIFEQQVAVRIFDKVIELGYTVAQITGYEISSVERLDGHADQFIVSFRTPIDVVARMSRTRLTPSPNSTEAPS